jgi:hypothetical protein
LVLTLVRLVDNDQLTVGEAIAYLAAIVGCTALVFGITVAELLLRSGDVLTSMQERREFGPVVLAVVGE